MPRKPLNKEELKAKVQKKVPEQPKVLKKNQDTPKRTGRPTSMTEEVIAKLEHAFGYGCTDAEACLYAGIDKTTLYDYEKKFPKFSHRKRQLKEKPNLLARQAVIQEITNPTNKERGKLALQYLERKKKDEFSPKQEVQHEVSDKLDKAIDGFAKFLNS